MTEAEWRTCDHPHRMLDALGDRIGDRHLRLFAVACCCRVVPLLRGTRAEASLATLELAEDFADGTITPEQLGTGHQAAYRARSLFADAHWAVAWTVADSARDAAVESAREAARSCASAVATAARVTAMAAVVTGATAEDRSTAWGQYESISDAARAAEQRAQADLLRDLLDQPFGPIDRPPLAIDATCQQIAEAIYRERAFDRLPVLGDALEEAGCDDRALLDHCRGDGPHVRGCWAVDRVRFMAAQRGRCC